MAYFKIPLTNTNQKFNVLLSGTTYKLQFVYRSSKWFMDVLDSAENPLILAIPLVMGDNLFVQYQHIIKGSMYVVNTNNNEVQGFGDLGNTITLYWSDS